jgi:hypothetical protein
MKDRDLAFGLVVLALVGLGVYWARGRAVTPEHSQTAAPTTVRAAGDAAPAPSGVSPPDVTRSDATVDLGDVRLVLSLEPKPPVAFAKFRARVQARTSGEGGAPTPLESGRVYFAMTMPMGDHRYSLLPAADGWHEADVVLPLCASGDRRWFATVEGIVAGRPRVARFQLSLSRPPTESSR